MSHKIFLTLLLSVILALALTGPTAAAGTWTSVGPSLGIYGINETTAIVTHPGSANTVWVGMAHGGPLRSTDRGLTWRMVGETLSGVRGLAADLSAPGALWAATETAIVHSGDRGDPWRQVSNDSLTSGLGDETIQGLAATRSAAAWLYVWTQHRVLESADGGRSWRLVVDTGAGSLIYKVAPAAPRILYLGLYGPHGYEMRKTRNSGLTWTALPFPDIDNGIGPLTVDGAVVFYSPPYGPDPGLWRSSNGGVNWREVLAGTEDEPFSVVIDPRVPGTVWALGGAPRTLWISQDNGETWAQRSTPGIRQLVAAGPEPGSLYGFGNMSTIARSTNGGRTWNDVLPASFSDPDRPSCRVSFQSGQPSHLAFVKGHELFRSNDGGATWWWLPTAPQGTNDVLMGLADPNTLQTAGVYITGTTANGGRTWSTQTMDYVELLVRATPKVLLAGGYGVLRSQDNGKTWTRVLPGSSPRDSRAAQITQKLVVDPAHPGLVFALTFLEEDFYPNHGPMNAYSHPLSNLWRSQDGGRTWKSIARDLDAFDFDAPSSRLWIVRRANLLVSADLGVSWQPMAQVPVDPGTYSVTDLVAPPGLPGTLYLTGGPDLLRTQDEGRTWETVATGGFMLLTLAPGDPRTLFAMSHEGLYRLRLPE